MDLVLYYNSLGSDLQQLHLTLQMTQVFMATSDKSITDLASTTAKVEKMHVRPKHGIVLVKLPTLNMILRR